MIIGIEMIDTEMIDTEMKDLEIGIGIETGRETEIGTEIGIGIEGGREIGIGITGKATEIGKIESITFIFTLFIKKEFNYNLILIIISTKSSLFNYNSFRHLLFENTGFISYYFLLS